MNPVREIPDLTSDEWWVLFRSTKFARERKAFVVQDSFCDRLVEQRLARTYRLGVTMGAVVLVPTARGEREVDKWKRRGLSQFSQG